MGSFIQGYKERKLQKKPYDIDVNITIEKEDNEGTIVINDLGLYNDKVYIIGFYSHTLQWWVTPTCVVVGANGLLTDVYFPNGDDVAGEIITKIRILPL